ncbi:activating transcription factor 7-interacting protein 1 [Cylas formicarius]|uniref:activating transcription factor 7-interacting protein 1 n=1 Tax=Cylas formicarius TaxID=197179 RepID=UPI002958A1B5|nr:activating transcription factor 7-interacting protein 1 [Cylas formicarius]XP_060519700.1 activating transcription factor 7-interacting protein 1 [Cylas formicarius]XP_060519701.1 activating transcription factor 7-interacting protein 1 [Cylas formicarius]XP_060519702.1 activating transcription factor 7-interacting protein 1 [Cylas formicarius]
MPSVTQCEPTQANLATLSALEIFDIFKSNSDNDKHTDASSEESFHLQLDEDDTESRSNVSSGKDREETEEDILNKFETATSCDPDHLDAKTEDRILNDEEHKNVNSTTKTTVELIGSDKYEKTGNGEFKSAYELENPESENAKAERNVQNDTEKETEIARNTDQSAENSDRVSETEADEEEKMIENEGREEDEKMRVCKHSGRIDIENDSLLQELEATIADNREQGNEEAKFPEKPKEPDEVSNQKAQENEYDLLDISVIRDCEEDDAIATALEDNTNADSDKESHSSEKSDEEQGERTENEASEGEKEDPELAEEESETVDQEEGALVSDSESKENPDVANPKLSELLEDGDEEMKEQVSGAASDEAKVPSGEVSEVEQSKEIILDSDAANGQNSNVERGSVKEATELEPAKALQENEETDKEKSKSSGQKRSLSSTDLENANLAPKKIKLVDNETADVQTSDKVKTLSAFAKFMQCRRFASKLSRSDLEQFCIQKICECVMMKSSEGELHQTIKKQEKCIENLKRDMQQLLKQSKDLEIVNKKLMSELRNQNTLKKPLVPLKITRSVGLQVRMNPGNDAANQRKRPLPSPQKQNPTVQAVGTTVVNRARSTPNASPVVKKVLATTPTKSPLSTTPTTTASVASNPLLTKALQLNRRPVVSKRIATPNARPKVVEPNKPANPGVIDLTDEDDRTLKGGNKPGSINKVVSQKIGGNQAKTIVTQKTASVPGGKGPTGNPPRTVATLPQGVRLTPGSVIASNAAGGSQMLYVLPTINSGTNGTQKLTFLNLQPTNGVLSTVNGSLATKQNNTITLKTLGLRKHPAPLPVSPKVVSDVKLKPVLPKPYLTIKKIDTGIILQWKMPYNLDLYESIASYQLYAYQETNAPPSTDMWRKVGDVKALALPMACTLTQFADKNKYYFAVRSVDVHKRIGAFSDPEEISL